MRRTLLIAAASIGTAAVFAGTIWKGFEAGDRLLLITWGVVRV